MPRLPSSFSFPVDPARPVPSQTQSTSGYFSFKNVPQLTAALKRGEDEAFSWLYHQWRWQISRYCFALAQGDEKFADEIAQAVWLRIVRHIRILNDEAALWNWIARAARNAATDQRRIGGRYKRALARFTDAWAPSPNSPEGSDSLLQALEKVLAELDPEGRALIEARYFSTDSLETIAARHDLSIRAVEGRLARLRKKLRHLISEALTTPS